MAAYVKYQDFVEQLCRGVHQLHAAGHDVFVVIHSDAPVLATDTSLSNLTQITGTGYTAGGIDIVNDVSESAGTASLTSGLASTDAVWTGGAGGFTAGQYVSIYNTTPTTPIADPLIASWDYGSSFTVAVGETFTVDFGASVFQLV